MEINLFTFFSGGKVNRPVYNKSNLEGDNYPDYPVFQIFYNV